MRATSSPLAPRTRRGATSGIVGPSLSLADAHAARASGGVWASSARKRADSSRWRRAGRRRRSSPSSAKIVCASGSRLGAGLRYSATSHSRTSPKRGGLGKTRRTTSCGATVPFQRFSSRRNATSYRASARKRVEALSLAERDRAAGVSPLAADAKAEVLPLADCCELGEPAAGREQRRGRVAEPERREPRELAAEVERERRVARDDRVDLGDRLEILLREHLLGMSCEGLGKRLDVLLAQGEAGGGAVAAPALEQVRTSAECGVEVEGRNRAARALPVAVGAGDEDDGAVVPLDKAGGDDPDHALVPVGAGDGVRAPTALLRRPRLDLGHGLAQDPRLDRLALAVQLLERVGETPRLVLVLGEQELERRARVAESARCVEARGEPEADGACVDGCAGSTPATSIRARRPGFDVRASARSPAIASERFSSTSGTTSAIVASATRSRCRCGTRSRRRSSACPSL